MLPHGAPDPPGRRGQIFREVRTCCEPGEPGCDIFKRHPEDRHAAAVATEYYLVALHTTEPGDDLQYPPLQGVAGVAVAPRLPALVDAHGEHPGVLAGAVAVDDSRFLACAR
jgi:hypothetical protein